MNEYEKRFQELQEAIQRARDKKTKGRTLQNEDLIRDAESSLDFHDGAMSELRRWFGNQITFNK